MVKHVAEIRVGTDSPSPFPPPPWEGMQVEGQVDQHRCEGWLIAEGHRTEGSTVLWTLRHASEGVGGTGRVRSGKVLDTESE